MQNLTDQRGDALNGTAAHVAVPRPQAARFWELYEVTRTQGGTVDFPATMALFRPEIAPDVANRVWSAIARLNNGVVLKQAQTRLSAINAQLDNQFHNQSEAPSNGSNEIERDRPENPFAIDVVKADGQEKHSEKRSDPSSTLQLDFPVPQPLHQAGSAVRELHVKVWEQEEPVSAATSPEKLMPAQSEARRARPRRV